MRIDTERNCKTYSCGARSPIPIQVAKSVEVIKTNTLHQFDTAEVVGLPSPVGKIPFVFYVKEGIGRGRKGVLYYGDRDTVCWMYPESEHAEWCRQPYDIKYDAVESFDNGIESGFKRNHGVFELWVSVLRKWYNGQVIYRPKKKIQGCGRNDDGYPIQPTTETLKEKVRTRTVQTPKKNQTINRSCNCRKEA